MSPLPLHLKKGVGPGLLGVNPRAPHGGDHRADEAARIPTNPWGSHRRRRAEHRSPVRHALRAAAAAAAEGSVDSQRGRRRRGAEEAAERGEGGVGMWRRCHGRVLGIRVPAIADFGEGTELGHLPYAAGNVDFGSFCLYSKCLES